MHIEKRIQEIKNANAFEVDYILDAAMERKRQLYPEWELFYCAAEKGSVNGPEDMIRAALAFQERIRRNFPSEQQAHD